MACSDEVLLICPFFVQGSTLDLNQRIFTLCAGTALEGIRVSLAHDVANQPLCAAGWAAHPALSRVCRVPVLHEVVVSGKDLVAIEALELLTPAAAIPLFIVSPVTVRLDVSEIWPRWKLSPFKELVQSQQNQPQKGEWPELAVLRALVQRLKAPLMLQRSFVERQELHVLEAQLVAAGRWVHVAPRPANHANPGTACGEAYFQEARVHDLKDIDRHGASSGETQSRAL